MVICGPIVGRLDGSIIGGCGTPLPPGRDVFQGMTLGSPHQDGAGAALSGSPWILGPEGASPGQPGELGGGGVRHLLIQPAGACESHPESWFCALGPGPRAPLDLENPRETCVSAKALQSCLTLCNPLDRSPPGSSVQRISQARLLEWVAMPSSRGSSRPRDQTGVSYVSCIGRRVLYHQRHLGSLET